MTNPDFVLHPDTPFPVGVEYYRGPIPNQEVWDADFSRIRKSGLQIVRSFSYWNHMEPAPGIYKLDDFDLMFDLAEKHDLYVWLDVTLATHGACPEWLLRECPDIRAVDRFGNPRTAYASAAAPQGGILHCYDHPAWKNRGGALLRHVIDRYKSRKNLLVWGLWDGVGPSRANSDSYPCYCIHSISAYKHWLKNRYTLDELNTRLLRRFHCWDDVEPPRDNHNVVEMLMFLRFTYENLVEKLKWMVSETRAIDPHHEVRAHGVPIPQPWYEACANEVDSWGMSMSSNNLLTSKNPLQIADRAFSFDAARALSPNGRWWNEEIYAGMSRGGVTWKKQSEPQELIALLWLTIAGGASGCMFWQYRPEYLSFEAPGYNLVALDGKPTKRLAAVRKAIERIDGMKEHLPVDCGRAQVGIVYHASSQELFGLNSETQRYNSDFSGVWKTLWRNGISADILTENMDWSGYDILFLPNVTIMDSTTRNRIEQTLEQYPKTRFVAEGSFGMYSADGQSSYNPPEGFQEKFGVRVADFSEINDYDIEAGRNLLQTPFGESLITSNTGYAILEPIDDAKIWATLGDETVGVRTLNGRFTWLGMTLSAGFRDLGEANLVLGLVAEAGVNPPVQIAKGEVVPVVRPSKQGGWILFMLNMEHNPIRAQVHTNWLLTEAEDLFTRTSISLSDDNSRFEVDIDAWEIAVIHCKT